VIPLKDDNPTRRFPFVTLLLLGLNVAAFVQELRLSPAGLEHLLVQASIVPARLVSSPGDPFEWLTLVTSTFLHGGILHLAGNMLFLWIFGDNVEDRLGHGRYLLFYVACGVVAGLAQVAAAIDSTVPVLGASGAVAGVLGAYLVLYPHQRVTTLVPVWIIPLILKLPAWMLLGVWFVMQVSNAYVELMPVRASAEPSGGVAWWAHAAGFLVGAIAAWPARRRRA